MAAMVAALAAGNFLTRRGGLDGLVKLAVARGYQGAQPLPRRLCDQRPEPGGLPRDLLGRGRIDGCWLGGFHGRMPDFHGVVKLGDALVSRAYSPTQPINAFSHFSIPTGKIRFRGT